MSESIFGPEKPALERDHYFTDEPPKVSPQNQAEIDLINKYKFPRVQAKITNRSGEMRILQRIFVVSGARTHYTQDVRPVEWRKRYYRVFVTDDSFSPTCRMTGQEIGPDGKPCGTFDCAPSAFVEWLGEGTEAGDWTIDDLPGIPANIKAILLGAGINTPATILAMGSDGLQEISGIGEATAEKLIAACGELDDIHEAPPAPLPEPYPYEMFKNSPTAGRTRVHPEKIAELIKRKKTADTSKIGQDILSPQQRELEEAAGEKK
jgi:hypothetical protein